MKERLKIILNDLGKNAKKEENKDYRNGYMDGLLDFYNDSLRRLPITDDNEQIKKSDI